MPTLLATQPGQSIAHATAQYVLQQIAPDLLPQTLLLLPTRRGCWLLRQAFLDVLGKNASFIPHMVALADLEQELPLWLPTAKAQEVLQAIPPAMPEWLRLSILIRHVMAFEKQRTGASHVSQCLPLAQDLAQLQDRFAQQGASLDAQHLKHLSGDDAQHWYAATQFLSILAEHWPAIEEAHGMMLASARQTRMLNLLNACWQAQAPDYPVLLVGSTASHPPTAALMKTIAEMPLGAVILPGLNLQMGEEEWEGVAAGHPYYHLKQFLSHWPEGRGLVKQIVSDAPADSIWLKALTPTACVAHWHEAEAPNLHGLRMVACHEEEEEVRVAALLIREALEKPEREVALITPDEQFMARVAAHLKRYHILADRLSRGTLANTQMGSLWAALIASLSEPERMLSQFVFFQHPLVMGESHEAIREVWAQWWSAAEDAYRGVMVHTPGQMPAMQETLRESPIYIQVANATRRMAQLATARLTITEWLAACQEILAQLQVAAGEGAQNLADQMEALKAAELLGAMDVDAFAAFFQTLLSEPWRGDLKRTHPQVSMLTPIEARLQKFDRVILANFTDDVWPGAAKSNAWLNAAHQQALGLGAPQETVSLVAHDVLLLGSMPEVFITYAARQAAGPATPSRFLERLMALLAVKEVPLETLKAAEYLTYAEQLDAAADYQPELPIRPTPTQRPQEIAVSSLDALFNDPFALYARYVLELRAPHAFDELPEARDFGTLAHRAIERLVAHWNEADRPADEPQLQAISDSCLKQFSQRANIRLFWNKRLLSALRFVNTQEAERRAHLAEVQSEINLKEPVMVGEHTLTLYGRMDRLERATTGEVTVGDYKTGAPPSENDIRKGKAVQLLAYALLLEARGEKLGAIDYWGLPSGKRSGQLRGLDAANIASDALLEKLRAALAAFMDPATPLLAQPIPNAHARFENPYDGISRYQEWAE